MKKSITFGRKIIELLPVKDSSPNGNTKLECGHYCTTYGVMPGVVVFCYDCKNSYDNEKPEEV